MNRFDPMRVIDVLARHGVEFVVIGGFAAELYRAPIAPTQDIDVTPRLSAPNLARLSAALTELGARVRTQGVTEGLAFSHDAESLARASIWNLTTTAGDFDLSFRPTGTDGYEDLAANALVVQVAGHDIAVANLADVVRSKEAAGRPKDIAALAALYQALDAMKSVTIDDLRVRIIQMMDRRRSFGDGADDSD